MADETADVKHKRSKNMEGRVTVRIPQRLIAELADIAMRDKKTVSDLLREAVLAYLSRQK